MKREEKPVNVKKEYDGPDQIPNEAIVKTFAKAKTVRFSIRNFNFVQHRFITFNNLGWWLPLKRVLPLIGITPQMLRTVFNPCYEVVKRRFPFNLSWFGLNKEKVKTIEIELPEVIETYEQLGCFQATNKRFQELAKILEKPVEVWLEDSYSGEHTFLFTAYPSGEITEKAKHASE